MFRIFVIEDGTSNGVADIVVGEDRSGKGVLIG
jgi:hypothetical protein